MSFLYAVTIYPLELTYTVLYTFLAEITGNYGAGLLCLSMVSTVLFVPLKRLAASMQAGETALQKVMAPQLAAIKAQSRGAERQARIRALYRRYAYNPLLALRSSFGILMQVPFLCAAYYMINGYTPLHGQGWWIIADLSKPDGLLPAGLHFLPILMTLFNFGALFTAPDFSRKDQAQGVVVALLFLLLLYPAPSALLVYWTGNNALLFLQNLWPKLLPRAVKTSLLEKFQAHFRPIATGNFSFALAGQASRPAFARFSLTAAGFFALFFIISIVPRAYGKFLYAQNLLTLSAPLPDLAPAIFSGLLFLALAALVLRAGARSDASAREKSAVRMMIAGTIVALMWFFIRLADYDIYDTTRAFDDLSDRFYDCLSASLLLLCLARFRVFNALGAAGKYLRVHEEPALFAAGIAVAGLTVFILSPVALYASSPEFFYLPAKDVLKELLPYLLLFFICAALLRVLLPRLIQPFATFAVLAAALVALLNSTLATGNYGSMDGPMLSNARHLKNPIILGYDFGVLLFVFLLLAALYYFRQTKKLLPALQALVVVICLHAGASFWATPAPPDQPAQKNVETLFTFSKTKPNVIIFFLDMFTGGHVEEIFAARPALRQAFSGFTWYPDTLTAGDMTSLSAPSLFGGPAFLPDAINADPSRTLNEKYTEALALLPVNFGRHGYTLRFSSPLYDLDESLFAKYADGQPVTFLHRRDFEAVTRRWMEKIGAREQNASQQSLPDLVLSVGLFKAVPHGLKKYVYNRGQWRFNAAGSLFNDGFQRVLSLSAVLGMLPEMSVIDDAAPTFTILYNELSHHPWHLPEDGLIPVLDPYPQTPYSGEIILVDGIIPEHLYTETHIMEMLANFFNLLREQDAYDNSLVILASDHCDADSRMLNEALGYVAKDAFTGLRDPRTTLFPGRPHGLLMVKPLDARAPFRADNALMSSMDVPALACGAVGGCPGITLPDTGPDRVRTHDFGATEWRQIEVKGKKLFDHYTKAVVRGSMFSKENWTVQP